MMDIPLPNDHDSRGYVFSH